MRIKLSPLHLYTANGMPSAIKHAKFNAKFKHAFKFNVSYRNNYKKIFTFNVLSWILFNEHNIKKDF